MPLEDDVRVYARALMERTLDRAVDDLKAESPVLSGALQDSIEHGPVNDTGFGLSGTLVASVEYAEDTNATGRSAGWWDRVVDNLEDVMAEVESAAAQDARSEAMR